MLHFFVKDRDREEKKETAAELVGDGLDRDGVSDIYSTGVTTTSLSTL